MNKKLNFIFKNKTNYKIILYLVAFIVIIFFVYFLIPKFFNYSTKLVEESLKKNSNLNIKNISNIDYNFFPSPRVRLSGGTLKLEENILEVEGAEIDIILKPLSIINYKQIKYDKISIRGGTTKIKFENINQLFNFINENKTKINFKKNNIVLFQANKKLFEINDNKIKISSKNENSQLNIAGYLLDHKISFLLKNKSENNSKIVLKIPELDISTAISLESKDNFRTFKGLLNIEVLNNFFRFNFVRDKNITINKGFIRNDLVKSSFAGEVSFKPHFFFNLDVEPTVINIKKLFFIIQEKYFSEELREPVMIKKINGSLNFKNKFEGNLIFENKKILFKNFKTGKDKLIFFNAEIFDLGRKTKIRFDLSKNIQSKKIQIDGLIFPHSSNVIFKKILLNEKILANVQTKKYEKKFKEDVVGTSLSNIFNELKVNSFFENFIN
jgi:hypothetical protein